MILLHVSHAQKDNYKCLIAFCDSASGKQLWGYKSRNGVVVIKPKYEMADTRIMRHAAFVVTTDFKIVVINQRDSVIMTPYIFDNGADYVRDGLFRFVENGKIGFADKRFKRVIPAQFDFANYFQGRLAAFNVGGKSVAFDDEHRVWSGGLWGFIDKHGKVVITPQFLAVSHFKGKYCEVSTSDSKHVLINKKGAIVKHLEQ
jgi:hypothetical protein